jgi:ComF family protein
MGVQEAVFDDDRVEAPGAWGLKHLRRLARIGRGALYVVLPPLCLSCQTRITAHDALCPACWRQTSSARPLCDRMGLPMPFDIGGPILSAAAIADPPDFDRSRGVACFDGLMRELIHAFKFHDSRNARRLFGRWLVEARQEIINEADLLVAVPLARGRLISRRFNQAQILAIEVGRRTGKPVWPFALVRSRATAHQIGLTRAQRSRNVVPPSELPAISGKAIVLIDDVITSGATASAAAAVVKPAGARRVDVLALAIVSDRIPEA